ncbi:MAG: phenylalanine--tRNA ligase subunit alpha [Candidatus Bathyarchaeota archaeon]|nr:phenylalanine--tRNA ligase subunit alpha [Candidatus Bathyarchaeota archaeon]
MVNLRALELKFLSALERLGGKASVEQLITEAELSDAAVMRTALTLQEKSLVKIHAEPQVVVKLSAEGEAHAENGLPERRLVKALAALSGEANIDKVASEAGLDPKFKQIALGWILRKNWAVFDSKTNMLRIADHLLHQVAVPEGNDEKLLRYLHGKNQAPLNVIGAELQPVVQTLKKRKLLTTDDKTHRILEITVAGRKTAKEGKTATEEVTQLTPELIITGKWRTTKLQKYNIKAPVARTWPGKKHPYLSFLEEVKTKLVTLGFKEMTGPNVETSFFNFDALYTPQDHPAREADGIYFVKNPQFGDITAYENAVVNVKATHENGWTTGSTGWGYKYSKQEAKRLFLRGHGTCLSARTLLRKDLEIPSRYFSIARCFRPEVNDKTHLNEFNQVEGIVVDEKLTLRDLLGVLAKFALEIASADEVRFKPDYFPFTEPSVELSAYKKGYGWIEFGGSGIFRPEVTLPLGIEVPVIAWGLGIDRLFMMRAGVEDIRDIFSQSLDWLRRKEVT